MKVTFRGMLMNLRPTQSHSLGNYARKILGKLSQLIALRTRELPVETIRQLCGELYLEIDEFLELVDRFEKYNRRRGYNDSLEEDGGLPAEP